MCESCGNSTNKSQCNCTKNGSLSGYKKWLYTLYTLIIYIIVSNPYTYKGMNCIITSYPYINSIIGKTSDKNGCPTKNGFILHALIFTIILRIIM